MTPAEELLVVRCQLGERAAVDALVEHWYPAVWRYARMLAGDDAVASDASHDAWIDALRGLPRLREPAAFRAWLFRVVRRRVVDGQRTGAREARKRRVVRAEVPEPDPPEGLAGVDPIDLERGLSSLAPGDREVLILFHIRGLSYLEIAEVTGTLLGTVRSRLHRARRQLQTHLHRHSKGNRP